MAAGGTGARWGNGFGLVRRLNGKDTVDDALTDTYPAEAACIQGRTPIKASPLAWKKEMLHEFKTLTPRIHGFLTCFTL